MTLNDFFTFSISASAHWWSQFITMPVLNYYLSFNIFIHYSIRKTDNSQDYWLSFYSSMFFSKLLICPINKTLNCSSIDDWPITHWTGRKKERESEGDHEWLTEWVIFHLSVVWDCLNFFLLSLLISGYGSTAYNATRCRLRCTKFCQCDYWQSRNGSSNSIWCKLSRLERRRRKRGRQRKGKTLQVHSDMTSAVHTVTQLSTGRFADFSRLGWNNRNSVRLSEVSALTTLHLIVILTLKWRGRERQLIVYDIGEG